MPVGNFSKKETCINSWHKTRPSSIHKNPNFNFPLLLVLGFSFVKCNYVRERILVKLETSDTTLRLGKTSYESENMNFKQAWFPTPHFKRHKNHYSIKQYITFHHHLNKAKHIGFRPPVFHSTLGNNRSENKVTVFGLVSPNLPPPPRSFSRTAYFKHKLLSRSI